MKSIVNLDSPMVSPPPDYPGEFFKDVRQGLIGVGLINVEDRSGILTLDKGKSMSFVYRYNYCYIITAQDHFVYAFVNLKVKLQVCSIQSLPECS